MKGKRSKNIKLYIGILVIIILTIFLITFFYFRNQLQIKFSNEDFTKLYNSKYKNIQVPWNPFSENITGNYKIIKQDGNQAFYNVTFEPYYNLTDRITYYSICHEINTLSRDYITKDAEGNDMITSYYTPDKMSYYLTDKLVKQMDINPNLYDSKDMEIKSTDIPKDFKEGDKIKFCTPYLNPYIDTYIRIGDNSTVIISNVTIYSNAVLENVTTKSNFSYLTINNLSTNPPYDFLTGYWSFDADVNNASEPGYLTTANDFSSYNLNGTPFGNVNVSTSCGIYGQGTCFDGAGDYITLPSTQLLNYSNFTVSAWMNTNTVVSINAILSIGSSEYFGTASTGNRLSIGWKNATGSAESTSACNNWINTSRWYHIVAVYYGNASIYGGNFSIIIYINGTNCANITKSTGYTQGILRYIGAGGSSGRYWNGSLDEIMIFNTTLNETQVKDIYNNQSSRFYGKGTQNINNLNLSGDGTENRVNVSLFNCSTLKNSNLSGQIGIRDGDTYNYNGNTVYFSSCNASNLTIEGNPNNVSLRIIFDAGNSTYPFYTPLLIGGNITLNSWLEAPDTTNPNINITYPPNNTNSSNNKLNVNYTRGSDAQSCWYSNDTYSTNTTLTNCINITDITWTEGQHNVTIWVNDSAGNKNWSFVRFTIDSTPPNCTFISRIPSKINQSSTGQFVVLLNCTDTNGINFSKTGDHYWAFTTRTLDSFQVAAGVPNRWSIRPPANDIAQIDSNLSTYGKIFRAQGRGRGFWYEFIDTTNLKILSGDRNLSSWFLYDNYSYSGEDGHYGYLTLKNESDIGRSVILNFTSLSIRLSAFRQNIPLSYDSLVSELKKNISINKNLQVLVYRNDLEAMKGSQNYTIIVFRNINPYSSPTSDLRAFYCNSSYSPTGGVTVIASPNCVLINSMSPTSLGTKVLTDRNSSYSQGEYSVINGKIGGIVATPYHYYYYDTLNPAPTKGYNYAYANGTTVTNMSFNETRRTWTSTNSGSTWTQFNGTLDLMEFTTKSTNDEFRFGYCIYDNFGNLGCNESIIVDQITATNHPISSPNLVIYNSSSFINDYNLNETHKGTMNIRVGCAKDPDSVGNVTHNLTLRNTDGTFNYTINASFLCPNDAPTWINFDTTKVPDGIYKMNITAIAGDNQEDIKSTLTGNNFTIDNHSPNINITYPPNNTYSNNQNLNINYTTYDMTLQSCWYSNDTYSTNTTLTNCINITSVTWTEGQHNVTVWVNDTVGYVNFSYVNFTIDITPPTFVNIQNFSNTVNTSFSQSITATDSSSGVGFYKLNDTNYFTINSLTGSITNVTNLSRLEIHYLNITVNDTLGNQRSGEFWINITPVSTSTPGSGATATCKYKKFGYYNIKLPWLMETNCI